MYPHEITKNIVLGLLGLVLGYHRIISLFLKIKFCNTPGGNFPVFKVNFYDTGPLRKLF